MDDKWSDQLRQKLQHHEEPAPDDLWNRIECRLEEISEQPQPKKKTLHRKLYTGLWSGAAAACVLLALWLGEEYGPHTMPVQTPASPAEILQSTARATEPEQTATQEEKLQDALATTQPKKHYPVAVTSSSPSAALPVAEKEAEEAQEEVTDTAQQSRGTPAVSELDRIRYPKTSGTPQSESALPESAPQLKSGRWTLAMAASQNMPQSQLNYGGQGDINKGKFHTATINGSSWGDSHLTDILLYNKDGAPETDVNHHQPITGGIKFQYRLNDIWSLESGLTYTLLRSELRSGGNSYFYKTNQRLHLLGIPIKVNYTFWQNRHWQTYAQAGMLFEKDIAGTETTDYYKEKQKVSSEQNNIGIRGLQYTALCGAGIQFNCTRHLGIYAEPGLAWHIASDKSIQTIYTDKPLNFSIELGMRLNW